MSTQSTSPEFRNVRRLGANAPHSRRNHFLGVTAGTFGGMAMTFFQPELIVIGLITALTQSPWLVALVPVINKGGGLAPQLLAGSLMEHLPRRRPIFITVAVVRVSAFAGLTLATYLLYLDPNALHLTLFFLIYLVTCMSGGTAYVTFMDMIGRLIPTHRVGSFMGMRQLLGGGVGVFVALLVVQPILHGFDLPANYLLLFAIGTILVGMDVGTWSCCREEPGARAQDRTTFRESMARGMHWVLHDHNYRCYFYMRVAFRIAYLGLAFFLLFGDKRLGYQKSAGSLAVLGGLLVAIVRLIGVISSGLWGRLADNHGSKVTMLVGGGFLTLSPLMALLAPHLPEGFRLALPLTDIDLTLPLLVWLLGLGAFHTGIRANILGGHRFLITHAPEHRRASYVAFLNTLTSPLTLLPLAGAWLIEVGGMDLLFACVAGGGLLSVYAAIRMHPDTTGLKSAHSAAAGLANGDRQSP